MRRSTFLLFDGAMLLLRLDGLGPRYTQITRALCALIQTGALAPGTRVPPTREVARTVGCARNVVLLAYEQLVLEGYLTSRGGAGTFVSSDLPVAAAIPGAARPIARTRRSPNAALSVGGRRVRDAAVRALATYTWQRGATGIDFIYGLCEPDARMVRRSRRPGRSRRVPGAHSSHSRPDHRPATRGTLACSRPRHRSTSRSRRVAPRNASTPSRRCVASETEASE